MPSDVAVAAGAHLELVQDRRDVARSAAFDIITNQVPVAIEVGTH